MIELPVLPVSPSGDDSSRSRFWRSVQQLEAGAEYGAFTGSELMPDAAGSPGGASRRQFLQIMGASMALAGLTACRKPVEAIVPFSRKPEEMIPGVPIDYATGMEFRGTLRPLLVQSTDGRPTKIEGNPEHPESIGSSGVFEQAALLALYDPDRSRTVLRDGSESSWGDFARFVGERRADRVSGRLAVVTRPSSSMTRAAMRQELARAWPDLAWVEYDTVPDGAEDAYSYGAGGRVRPRYHFDRARVILSLEADFLGGTDIDHLHNTASFARSRAVDRVDAMSRLYVAESGYTITGGAADHRLPFRRSDLPKLAAAVARRVGVEFDGDANDLVDHPWVIAVADDLLAAGPQALVVSGGDGAAQTFAAAMNRALGAVGNTVELLSVDDGAAAQAAFTGGLPALSAEMLAGRIDTLVILDANPAYDLPDGDAFVQALASVEETVHVGLYVDETAQQCRWHVPLTHFLEAWGDGRSYAGTRSVTQPLIAPLYADAHSAIEVLGLFASGMDRSGHDLVRDTWRPVLGAGGFEGAWRRVIHDGFLPDSAFPEARPVAAGRDPARSLMDGAAMSGILSGGPGSGLEVVIHPDSKVFDGSFANNAWLQELPDPITKVVWDNVAAMSPETAAFLGVGAELRSGRYFADRVTIAAGDGSIDLPVWILPGMAPNSVHVAMGYGRSIRSVRDRRPDHVFDRDHETDIYGQGAVSDGVGARITTLSANRPGVIAAGVSITRSGGDYLVASTQDHGAMPDEGGEAMDRGLYRMATVEEYRDNPGFVADSEPKPIREDWSAYPALWQNAHPADQPEMTRSRYHANQWGMVIDLNSCTGCNACLVACQAENNIQVVGKDQVSRGREMHWIRLDRYFVGDGADASPMLAMQPVPCQHCENAPCESVCPVAATVHSPDGTNQMIYNRCIGTRYCANNCPYKVRRFNYYNWSKTLPESLHLAQNPNVTVRSRGVMEKCSYCIQRVREVNKLTNVENREIRDGEVRTACQQACPAQAIVFGDLADPDSAVSAARTSPRRYELLAELAVKPRTSYLGRIRNPNPSLEGQA